MSIDTSELLNHVIYPTLKEMHKKCPQIYSDSAVNLLLGTAAIETEMGTFLKQLEGPALGIYQMEPDTHLDIWKNYLSYRLPLRVYIRSLLPAGNPTKMADHLLYNLKYATAMCRIHYLRVQEKLPSSYDVEGLARYWKKYYNTEKGHGSTRSFVSRYDTYIGV